MAATESSIQRPATPPATDWNLCALCQKHIPKDRPQCPANAKQRNQGSTYVTLAQNLKTFHELGELPPGLLDRLDEGDGLEETFRKRKACFHSNCRAKYNSTKLKRKAAASDDPSDASSDGASDRKFTRRESESFKNAGRTVPQCSVCCLCDQTTPEKDLRNASTFQLDERIRKCAIILQDSKLLATLSAGDVISQELKYHTNCLIDLYRRAKPKEDNKESDGKDRMRHGLAFAELTEYMQEVRDTSSSNRLTVFKLADLTQMYHTRMQDCGFLSSRVHSGRLKTRLLAHFPDLQAHNSGRDVLLTFSDDLNSTLREAYTDSWDDEAVHLATAARIVRRDMFLLQSDFTGSYDSQYSSIPETLLALMQMILQGPSIETANRAKCQASLSLAQLASFNAVKTEGNRSRQNAITTRHSKNRETPVPVYVGLTIHAKTRKQELVDSMYALGLSVSYKRVLEISSELARKACAQFEEDQVVCPMKLKHGLFTTAAIDNIDHNPSSTTAKDSFHGTAISIFQHPTESCSGSERTCSAETSPVTSRKLTVPELPGFYTIIPPFVLKIPVEPPPETSEVNTNE